MANESTTKNPTATWRYVIPNAVTSASLVLGLGVLAVATQGEFELAGWLMVWCVLLDKLDGTFARLLGASSKFGAQLDSLADMVVFGVVPAGTTLLLLRARPDLMAPWLGRELLMYAMLSLFAVCASLRLAKFNVLADEDGPPVFFGLPTTVTGGILALLLLIGLDHQMILLLRVLPVLALILGLLMVSNIVLPKIGHSSGLFMQVFRAVTIGLCYVFGFMRVFPEYLLGISLFYILTGIVLGLLRRDELLSGKGPEDGADLDLEPQPG
ncbi:CDP-alcohol phosphatidyltransferase [Enhygromyxa salina]|uniref:CDP-alcohol phosphatidyltransferase n=1 Tax=Enhygromyxa salina TaxID=215803 RepID=A0A2S9XGZ9_9BACT|nr:CDP-alcohol phosphatidyltransferase family protein [Enhygromyxa salina]PRP92148.1 CDP-alcohol phosphatidyltransferase [Enhygromyxa salina]